MIILPIMAAGLVVGGPLLAIGSGVLYLGLRSRPRRTRRVEFRPVLMMLLVELRAGSSVLAAIQSVASRFPRYGELNVAARVATVGGIETAVDLSRGQVRVLLTHLARAQASGGSAADAVRRMLDSDIARERSIRLARTRALPVRLMIPVTLLLLPGVVLLVYGPVLVSMIDDLAVPFG